MAYAATLREASREQLHMGKSASYFLSRIIKGGLLDVERVISAMREAGSVESRGFAWTIVDIEEGTTSYHKKPYRYLAGRLVKYDPDAFVEVVDEATRRTRLQSEPNMQRAASLFVYLPDEAIFGHKRVWNEIRATDFRTQLAAITNQATIYLTFDRLPV